MGSVSASSSASKLNSQNSYRAFPSPMATYLRRAERVRVPLGDPDTPALASPSVAPTRELTVASHLIFPSPPSVDPPTPPPSDLRRGSTSLSIPTSLISSVEGRSPSGTPSDSWDDVSSDARRNSLPPEPLTRDRLALLQSGLRWTHSDNVELWDWSGGDTPTSSPPSSIMQGRRPLSGAPTPTISTEYESASSELHFSTATSSHALSEDEFDFGSLFLVALRSREIQRHHPDPSASVSFMPPKVFRFPFESILRFLFDLDPSTLDLLKEQPRPHPDGTSTPSELFPTHLPAESTSLNMDKDESSFTGPRASLARFSDEAHEAIRSIRKGLDAIAEHNAPAMHGPFMGAARVPRMIIQAVLRI